jgi:glycosyltransferase involved in cell wall biosynthesis
VRLAFLTPLPPAPTGVADYSADVLAALAGAHAIDVFHGQDRVDEPRLPASCAVHPASAFIDLHRRRPYDVAVYQMGNAPAHDFLYPLLSQVPGLLVLHELVLHHARARMLLDTPAVRAYAREPWSAARRAEAVPAVEAYREEVAYSYPQQAGRLVEAQLATSGDLLPYAYPLFRLPVEASRLTAVHNRFMAEAVRGEVPGAEVAQVRMAAGQTPVARDRVAALRARLGIAPDEIAVGCFGLMTREKRLETVARAVARATVHLPRLRLLLVGPVPDGSELEGALERAGVVTRAVLAGRVPLDELPAYLEATDIVAHLRYPTGRETSAALLRALAQGRPAIVSDLENLDDIRSDAVVRTDVTDEEGELLRAILRLAASPDERSRLGERARAFVAREHTPARCRQTYEEALQRAAARPDPTPGEWPRHWPRPLARP